MKKFLKNSAAASGQLKEECFYEFWICSFSKQQFYVFFGTLHTPQRDLNLDLLFLRQAR
jgi:hypothetical protein